MQPSSPWNRICCLTSNLCLDVKSYQTLWDPMDCSSPGSSVHGILQARVLEWVAISVSRGSSKLRNQTQISLIEGRCFTIWPTREATNVLYSQSTEVQFSSVTQSCLTLCHPMDCSMPGFPVHHQLSELAQTHVHRVGDAIPPSHPLLFPWRRNS